MRTAILLLLLLASIRSAGAAPVGAIFGGGEEARFAHDSSLRVDLDFGVLRLSTPTRAAFAVGFAFTLTLPLDRLALPRRAQKELNMPPRPVGPWAIAAVVPALAVGPALGKEPRPAGVAPSASASGSASIVPSAVSSTVTPPTVKGVTLDGDRIRALVNAAHKLAGLDRDDVYDAIASRARTSALLPEVRIRVFRIADTGLTLYDHGETDPTRSTLLDGTRTGLETRLSFRLDRLVFADEEIALERLRLERLELKQKLATRVIELVVRWAKAERASRDVLLLDVERDAAAALALEALAVLDALTGGLATKLLARAP